MSIETDSIPLNCNIFCFWVNYLFNSGNDTLIFTFQYCNGGGGGQLSEIYPWELTIGLGFTVGYQFISGKHCNV
jgi:hypothetical protein